MYEVFYEGANYGLEPPKGGLYTGAHVPGASIGATTGVQTANQIKDVADYLNQGMKTVEVSMINPEVFDMIPKQHLKEINRISKLAGSETTFHVPIVEPSGFTQQGWSEKNREAAEKQITDTIIRASAMRPEGGMPATMHSSNIPGSETMPVEAVTGLSDEEKKKYKDTGVPTKMIAVNQESGELIPLEREMRYYPEHEKGVTYTPEQEIQIANRSYWDNKLSNLIFYKERGDELMAKNLPLFIDDLKKLETGQISKKEFEKNIGSNPEKKAALNNFQNAGIYVENAELNIHSLYNQAYKVANEKTRARLDDASAKYRQALKNVEGEDFSKRSQAIQQLVRELQVITQDRRKGYYPEIYKPVEQFAMDKASETFSNVALNAYKKLGNKAPIVSIENPPYGFALSTGSDLKNLIVKTREKFIEKAKKKGYSDSQAKQAAEQLIGATWDTSHISMIRKQGYGKEKLVEEAKIIAPFVKHVHLNDNFGFSHNDLPPGMGDVPFDKIIKELQKKGYKGKHIFEGGQFFQHFKTAPHAMILEGMGAPVYTGPTAAPTWSQIYGTMGSYTYSHTQFPEQHFGMYGSSFTGLPQELGGQAPGRQSRVSGAPMT